MSLKTALKRYHLVLYGIAMAFILLLLKWMQWHFIIIKHSYEVYIALIALLFLGLGIWLAMKLSRPKTTTVVVEKEIYIESTGEFNINEAALNKLGLSKRELEVLELMSAGLSNDEIANKLYVSINTIKTHSKNLFEKMSVERRTQAIDMGKRLRIIP